MNAETKKQEEERIPTLQEKKQFFEKYPELVDEPTFKVSMIHKGKIAPEGFKYLKIKMKCKKGVYNMVQLASIEALLTVQMDLKVQLFNYCYDVAFNTKKDEK